MKKFTTEYLLHADPSELEFIVSHEVGGNDAVLWRSLDDENPTKDNFFHHLIKHQKHDHLLKLTPSSGICKEARSHLSDGKNFIHLASIYANTPEMLAAIAPFLDKAISEDAGLLNICFDRNMHPLASAITHDNPLMVRTLLKTITQVHQKLSSSQLRDLFVFDSKTAGNISLYEFAEITPHISDDILSLMRKHGAHLFSKNPALARNTGVEFSSPEAFINAVNGEGSSHALVLEGSKDYWISCLRALQFTHSNSTLTLAKYVSLEKTLTGDEIVPSAAEDLEIITQLLFIHKSNSLALRDLASNYEFYNPIKTFSNKMLHLENDNPRLAGHLAHFVTVMLCLIELSCFVYYVIFVDSLHKEYAQSKTHLKNTYPQCFDKHMAYSLDYFCQLPIHDWSCNNKTEPWYDRYVDDYKHCKHTYAAHRDAALSGIPLYFLSFLTLLTMYFWPPYHPKNEIPNYSLVKLPFRLANTIFGEYNPETLSFDKFNSVHQLITAFELFMPIFEGEEKEAIKKTVDRLKSPLTEIKIKDIDEANDALLSLLGGYAAHLVHLPLRSRVSVDDLSKLNHAFQEYPKSDNSYTARTFCISRDTPRSQETVDLNIKPDCDIENEGALLIEKSSRKSRCTII